MVSVWLLNGGVSVTVMSHPVIPVLSFPSRLNSATGYVVGEVLERVKFVITGLLISGFVGSVPFDTSMLSLAPSESVSAFPLFEISGDGLPGKIAE